MRRLAIAVTCLAVLASLCPATPSVQTRRWRIAMAGGQTVLPLAGGIAGYMSLLALHGLPRERIEETELADINRLRQFDVVIVAWSGGSDAAMQALEQFANEGGIVVTQTWPLPSAQALAGQRLGPATTSNMRFVESPSPITRGLPELGVISAAGYTGGSIIPQADSQAVVLARYTDEATPDQHKGHFREGDQGAPAVLLIPYGKGYIVYSGPCTSPNLVPADQPPEHFICRILDVLSGGQVRGRLFTGVLAEDARVTQPAAEAPAAAYPAGPGPAAAAPQGFETLEEADGLQDFLLTAKLPAEGEARALIGYWSPGDTDELVFAGGKLTARRLQGGKPTRETTVLLPSPAGSVLIARRQGLISVAQEGKCIYSGYAGPVRQGVLAAQGLAEPTCQPLEPVAFADDFMRESGATGEWEPASGSWQVVASEGTAAQGANPFNYQVSADANGAISLAGESFWSDVALRVAMQTSAQAAGVIVNYQAADRYHLLKLVPHPTDSRASRLQLVQRTPQGEQGLAETVVNAGPLDWHRLEVRTSRGRLQAWLNRRLAIQARCDPAAMGRIGLFCQGGPAAFDDTVVSPWYGTSPMTRERFGDYLMTGGAWSVGSDGVTVSGSGAKGGRLLAPWPAVADCQAQVRVRPGGSEAGLVLRSGPAGHILVTLSPDGKGMKLVATRQGAKAVRLGEKAVTGSANEWHGLTASYFGPYLRVGVDGRAVMGLADTALPAGAPGVFARGDGKAQFQEFQAWREDPQEQLADEPTPAYAGVIDRHTWAGRSGAWMPDPANLNCLWHRGYFPAEVRLEVGVHPMGEAGTSTTLHIAPKHQPGAGYALAARRTWAAGTVDVSLSLQGKVVASGSAPVEPSAPYALRLQREGQDVLAYVNGRPALSFHDAKTHLEFDGLGLDNGGQLVCADDVAVTSPWVHDYTFETAPTDWTVESGTWKVSSRWSCSPGWSWFAGMDPGGPAMIASREAYSGDMDIVTYVAAKMMPAGERLTDIHLVCSASDTPAESGYHFILGGKINTMTALLREGQQVLESPWRIPQAALHNDWLRLMLQRRGAKLSLWAWDTPVMEWEDPQPLTGGRIKLGTFQNGVIIPRVSVFARQPVHNLLPEPPAAPVASGDGGGQPGTLALAPRPLSMFVSDGAVPEFGGSFNLWPQATDCQGTATYEAADAEGGAGGCMKIVYAVKADPKSFSYFMTSGAAPVDLSAYDRLVIYVKGDVPSLTLVVKDGAATTDPLATAGIADFVLKGITNKWQRFELPCKSFVPRQQGGQINWAAINHIGLAMIAPQNAEAGTFWVDNLRAEKGTKKK